ncbi:unnamed protein product [Clonostachys rosea]|uniref:Hydantoinase A/oxoprolinase domain-containing protein n=1 Tax=Bionectria ochroleuca TaxID=29856 RepID=A0ABY6UI28_BIOOC|nr:unnamed protein product [Clonostachys rosea]
MGQAIRATTEAREHDTSAHNLGCFRGGGGQHAYMKRVIMNKFSNIFLAYDMALTEVSQELLNQMMRQFASILYRRSN